MANDATFTMTFRVREDGSLVAVEKNINKAGKSVKGLNDAQESGARSASRYNEAVNGGVSSANNSARGMSKLLETIGGNNSGLVAAYATLATNAFAVSAAFNLLREASQAEQVLKGLEVQGAKTGRTLTLASKSVQELTKNALSSAEAMKATAQFTAAGFNTKQLQDVTRVATDASIALGRNIPDSMERIIKGVTKLEPELLDELGIMTKLTEASEKYARENNRTASSLNNFEKRQAFLNAVIAEGSAKFGGISDKVDTNPYDKLAASFSDLTKSILGLVNIAMKPLVAIFASNQLALLGSATLFISSIRNQLLPGLSEASKKSKEFAQTQQEAASKELESINKLKAGRRVAYNEYIEALKSQTATEAQYKAAIAERNKAETTISQRKVSRGFTETTRASQLDQNKKQIEALTEAHNINAKAVVANARANATTAATELSIYNLKSQLVEVIKNSAVEWTALAGTVQKTEKGTIGFMGTMELVGKRTAMVGRIIAISFLQMLPIIGQATLVIGVLIDLYDRFIRSDAEKEKAAALSAYNEVLKSTAEKSKELKNIQTSLLSAQLLTEQANINQANSLTELAAANEKVIQTLSKKRAQEEASAKNGRADARDTIISKELNIGADSVAFEAFNDRIKEGMRSLAGVNPELLRAAKNFAALEEIAPKAAEDIIRAAGGMEEFQKASDDTIVRKITAALNEQANAFRNIPGAIEAAKSSVDNLNNSITDLYKNMIPSTPYDAAIKGLNESERAFISLEKEMAKGKDATGKFSDFYQKLNQDVRDVLQPSTKLAIESVEDLTKAVQTYENQKKMQGSKFVSQTELDTAKSLLNTAQENSKNASKDLKIYSRTLETKRDSLILTDSEIQLAQARLSMLQKQDGITGAALIRQISQENAIKQMQASKLEAEKAILDVKVLGIKTQIEELKGIKEISKELQDQLKLRDEARLIALQAERTAAKSEDNTNRVKELDEEITNIKTGQVDRTEELAAKQKELDLLLKGSEALQNNISAILTTQISKGEALARAAQKDLDLIIEKRKIENDRDKAVRDRLNIEEKIRKIVSGQGPNTISQDIANIENDLLDRKISLQNSFNEEQSKFESEIAVYASMNAQEAVAHLEEKKKLAEGLYVQNVKLVESQRDLAILEKVYLDTRKEGLDFQQQSLANLQKEADLNRQIQDSKLKTTQINKELALKAKGLYKSEEQQQAFEIQAATQSYQLAVKEAALKKSLIDLEFALLDGQREILKEQLIQRKSEMLSSGYYKQDDTAIKQLSTAIDNISRGPSGASLAEKSKQLVDENISQLGANLKNLITMGGSADNPVTKMISTLVGLQEKSAARDEAKKALKTTILGDPVAKAVVETGDRNIKVAATGVARSNELLQQISDNTSKNVVATTKVGNISSTDSAGTMAKKVADLVAADKSVRVSEIQGYGPIGKHGEGSLHYKKSGYRAFDLNVPGIGDEASNAAAKAILDQKAIEISKTGMEVLWNGMIYQMGQAVGRIRKGDKHTDHLHAEVDSQAYSRMKSIYTNMGAAATEGASRAANDNAEEIVVTAKSPGSATLRDPGALTTGSTQISLPTAPDITTWSNTNWDSIKDKISEVSVVVDAYAEKLKALGPDGEVVAAIAQGSVVFAGSWTSALKTMDTIGATTADKVGAIASAMSASIGVIQSITSAASNAKIAGIDKEIAAEEKRDGKSAASVAKLDALEKKKDGIARKQFSLNKKLMMAQAVMSTAAGVAGALAAPFGLGIPLAILIGAMGAAQIALIAGTTYESSYSPKAVSTPSNLSIGKRSDTVDLARGPNANAGGEVAYLRGSEGTGSNASNYRTVGSAYGGELMRGYGNRGFVVGEKGPEVITPDTPISVTPANDVNGGSPINANINISALDSQGVQDVLVSQKGNIIKMLREAANASGKSFMEDVNVNVYTRPSVGKL